MDKSTNSDITHYLIPALSCSIAKLSPNKEAKHLGAFIFRMAIIKTVC